MRLAVSNIGWDVHDDVDVLDALQRRGVSGIEVAPTKVWPDWVDANEANARRYAARLRDMGFQIPALQAVLFGRADLQLFEPLCHGKLLDHMKRVAELSAALGARAIVFGSPRNRLRRQVGFDEAMDTAAELFSIMATNAHEHGCFIGLEHNPVDYGCDFITNVVDARILVSRVDHPGFRLHLDAGGLELCGGPIDKIIRESMPAGHYHASEPMLAPIAGGTVNHGLAIRALRDAGYVGWVSIEMKPSPRLFDSIDVIQGLLS